MIVLGFDTATSATAVGLRLADGTGSRARDDPAAGEHPGHATRLLPMAEELLDGAGLAWSEVDRIVAGVGPGTFTGLRVGLATARGLAQSIPAQLVGVSSLQTLAAGAYMGAPEEHTQAAEVVLAVIDARRGEAFVAAYARGAEVPLELCAPCALPPERLGDAIAAAGDRARASGLLLSLRPASWLAVGDGAVRYRERVEGAGVAVPPDGDARHLIDGAAICELGLHAAAGEPYEKILPDYRRRPDAELALEAAAASTIEP